MAGQGLIYPGFDEIFEHLTFVHANNQGGDQPAHPRSLIIALVIRSLDSIVAKLAACKVLVI